MAAQNRVGGGDAVQGGHPDIHEDDVGLSGLDHGKNTDTVGGLTDHAHVLLRIEDHAEAGTDQVLIVHQRNAQSSGHIGSPPGFTTVD